MVALRARACRGRRRERPLAGEHRREGLFAVDAGLLPVFVQQGDAKLGQEREHLLAAGEAQRTLNIRYGQNWPVSTTDGRHGLGEGTRTPTPTPSTTPSQLEQGGNTHLSCG